MSPAPEDSTMLLSRSALCTALVAVAAFSTTATAQTAATVRGSTTEQLLATVNAPTFLPMVAPTANATESVDLIAESVPASHFGGLPLHSTDHDADDDEAKGSEPGFFGSATGRFSMVALAAAASAGTFVALNDNGSPALAASQPNVNPATGPGTVGAGTPAFSENPEPASMALLALGLGAMAVVARRRRAD
jgi:PEP-CTERM motif